MRSAARRDYHRPCPELRRPSPGTLPRACARRSGTRPAVLIHGPRQSGKTTLARTVGESGGYRYVSFDDEAVWRAAR